MADPISDMFIRIKNAQKAGHESVIFPYSKFKHEISKVLERSGLVGGVEKRGKKVRKFLELALKYKDKIPAVSGVALISRPSRRMYADSEKLRGIARHGGVVIVTTSKGVMTHKEAFKAKVGGQLLAEVW